MTGSSMPLNHASPSKDEEMTGKVKKLPKSIRINKVGLLDLGCKRLFKVVKSKKTRDAPDIDDTEIRPPFSGKANSSDKVPAAAISSHFQFNPSFVNQCNQKFRNEAVIRYWRKKFVSRNAKHVY